MCRVRPPDCVAQKVGAELGFGSLLLRRVSQSWRSCRRSGSGSGDRWAIERSPSRRDDLPVRSCTVGGRRRGGRPVHGEGTDSSTAYQPVIPIISRSISADRGASEFTNAVGDAGCGHHNEELSQRAFHHNTIHSSGKSESETELSTSALPQGIECFFEVGDEVIGRLDANGQADERGGNFEGAAGR
jgi:hypothetical protein